MSNPGVGIGAFLTGLSNGVNTMANIQDMISRKELRDMQMKDLKRESENKDKYNAILQSAPKPMGITPVSGPNGEQSYTVDGKSYGDQTTAQNAANTQNGDLLESWRNTVGPQLQQHWLETGDIEKAQNFDKWMEDKNVQKGMNSWAQMAKSFQTGDKSGFLKHLNSTLTQTGYYDGSVQPIEATEKMNDKGQMVGYTVRFKDKATGKESTQDYDGAEIQKLAVVGLSPSQIYSQGIDELRAGQKARAEAAKTADTRNWEVTKMGMQQDNTQQNNAQNSQLRRAEEAEKLRLGGNKNDPLAKAKATEEYLRSKGYNDEYIANNAPALVGIQNQNKSTTARVEDYIKTQSEADSRGFARLPIEQKIKQAQEYITAVDGATGGNIKTPVTTNQPVDQQQQQGQRLFWDNSTNSMITR